MPPETEKLPEDEVLLEEVAEGTEAEGTAEEPKAEEGELEVTLGEDAPAKEGEAAAEEGSKEQKREAYWIRNLRKLNKKQDAELRELRQKLQASGLEPATAALPKEPELEDYDYDADRFKQAWKDWNNKAAQAKAKEEAAKSEQTAAEQSWNARLAEHEAGKAKIGVADYQDCEDLVRESLDATQYGILLSVSDNSNLMMVGLGRNHEKLDNLSSIKDPAKFIKELTKLEMNLKTTKRAPATKPESRPQLGSVGKSQGSQATLDKLRADADKTGDRSKVVAYMRQMRAAK